MKKRKKKINKTIEEVYKIRLPRFFITDLKLQPEPLKFGPANRRIRAGKPDLYDQKYLDCKEDDPVLEVEQVAFLSDMCPFEFSQTRHRYDKGEFYVNNLI